MLLDIDMPNINGLELLEEIKQFDGGIQVIMLTGVVTTTNVLRFSTEGQSLWGPDREGENVKGFKVDILDDHIDETVGEIKRYDVEVDNQRAVDVWERAVSECDAWKKRDTWGPPA